MRRDPYRAQAEKLRQKIERVEYKPEPEAEQAKSLPKRSDIHQEKRKKIKYPLIKGMLAVFVILPVLLYGLYSFLDINQAGGSAAAENGKLEEVTYETRQTEEKVKSGTNLDNEGRDLKAAESNEKDSVPESEAEQPQTASSKEEESGEEVNEQDIVQLTDQNEAVSAAEYDEKVQVIEHIVKPQETLFRIAMNYYNSQSGIEKIKEWNNLANHDLEAGQVIKIPLPVD
ncbi:LysM peptidoglycan-binding domain-containing protein [Bacillus sp. AK031]